MKVNWKKDFKDAYKETLSTADTTLFCDVYSSIKHFIESLLSKQKERHAMILAGVADQAEQNLTIYRADLLEEGEDLLEFHTHNSIPCLTGDEDEGCITCVRNKAIADVLKIIVVK